MTARTKYKDKHDADVIARQMEALKLRISGWSYRRIGDTLKISHQQVKRDVEGELKRLANENLDKADELRELELTRLDHVIESMDSWLVSGNPQAANVYIKAIQERNKLLGLYAPEKKDVTSGGEKLEIVIRNANAND